MNKLKYHEIQKKKLNFFNEINFIEKCLYKLNPKI